jgi:cytochrome c peroxidase
MNKPLALAVLVALTTVGVGTFLHGAQRDRGRREGRRGTILAPLPSALPRVATAPPGNHTTPEKVALGRLLFWDPILSGSKDVACATCHHPEFGYAENLDISIGVNGVGLSEHRRFASPNTIPFVKRNSQTILNTAFSGIDQKNSYDPAKAPMFWDIRVFSLETQALQPIKTLEEMRGNAYPESAALGTVVARLNAIAEYRALFQKAFGPASPARNDGAVTADNVGLALAAFERSLIANNSPFDRYMRGDRNAMTAAQTAGMRSFERVGCVNCHNGPMFSDYKLHVLSVPDNAKLPASDGGASDTYAFRTASLRNLAFTAPYMHSGVFTTLRQVLRFYDDVEDGDSENRSVGRSRLDPLLRELNDVDDETREIIDFLDALNDDSFDKTIPNRVPSGLPPGGNIS